MSNQKCFLMIDYILYDLFITLRQFDFKNLLPLPSISKILVLKLIAGNMALDLTVRFIMNVSNIKIIQFRMSIIKNL